MQNWYFDCTNKHTHTQNFKQIQELSEVCTTAVVLKQSYWVMCNFSKEMDKYKYVKSNGKEGWRQIKKRFSPDWIKKTGNWIRESFYIKWILEGCSAINFSYDRLNIKQLLFSSLLIYSTHKIKYYHLLSKSGKIYRCLKRKRL